MKYLNSSLALGAFAVVGAATTSQAAIGRFFVSGDTSVVYALPGGPFGQMPNDNGVFFSNVLGSGTSVRIYDPGLPGAGTSLLNNWYNAIPGVSSSTLTGTITPLSLSGVSLLYITLPQRILAADEISTLHSFVAGGSTLFVIGEHSSYDPAGNARANSLLQALGSSLLISNSYSDPNSPPEGWNATPGNGQVVSNPLTTGVNSFIYGGQALSSVSGGQSLFLLKDISNPFISLEIVPAPSGLAVVGFGSLVIARRRHRR